MSNSVKRSKTENLYSGGLAELVDSPSQLTCSFLNDWFTGKGSLGKAMQLLGIPYQSVALPLFVLKDNELLVDLCNEEQTLYRKTIFTYEQRSTVHETPKLIISAKKSINPVNLLNTNKILFTQSRWIANPEKVVNNAQKFVNNIPDGLEGTTIKEVDEVLTNKVWPAVIAVGLLSEFFSQLVIKETKYPNADVNSYVANAIAKSDWFFLSIADQIKVKQKKMRFSEYMKNYGVRADKDYELTSPRWYEIQDVIKKRIDDAVESNVKQTNSLHIDKKLQLFVDTSIQLQLLRSESKRKTLLVIDHLRKLIIGQVPEISYLHQVTKQQLISGKIEHKEPTKSKVKQTVKDVSALSGKGMIISAGYAKGLAKHIINNNVKIPKEAIGIFANASPEFAVQYPKCTGMIFLKGGPTSHGAIVAREYGIPAIIDSQAESIPDDAMIELNATTGNWKIV